MYSSIFGLTCRYTGRLQVVKVGEVRLALVQPRNFPILQISI